MVACDSTWEHVTACGDMVGHGEIFKNNILKTDAVDRNIH